MSSSIEIIKNKFMALCKRCIKYINNPSYVFYSYHVVVDSDNDEYIDQLCSGCLDCSICIRNQQYIKKQLKDTKIQNDWLIIMKKPLNVLTNEERKESISKSAIDRKLDYYEAERLKVIDIINIHDPSIALDHLVIPSQKINPETDHELEKVSIVSITHTNYEKGKYVHRFGQTVGNNTDYLNRTNIYQIGVPYFKVIASAFSRIISIVGIEIIK
jgi:hypothetical protein